MQETGVWSLDLGRFPGVGNGNSLQYPCLENSMDRGTQLAIVHRVPNSRTRLKQLNTHVNSWLFRAKRVTGKTSCSLIQQAFKWPFNWPFKSLLFKFPGDSDANRCLRFPCFFFSCTVYRILASQPGMEHRLLHWKHRVLTTGQSGNFHKQAFGNNTWSHQTSLNSTSLSQTFDDRI